MIDGPANAQNSHNKNVWKKGGAGTEEGEKNLSSHGPSLLPAPSLPFSPLFPWLAPLAGHTDLAFRVLCREEGAAVACTEMVSAKGLVYGMRSRKLDNATRDLLRTTPYEGFPAGPEADSPLVAQLFGDEPEFLRQAAQILRDWGFAWLDLNLGCSVPKVLKSGAGAALAWDVDKALATGEAMIREAGPGRVGFKLRLGRSRGEETYLELGRGLAALGAGWLTLHPRYSRQGFSGRADWAAIGRLARDVSVPVLASGDLLSAQDAADCLKESGAAGVMFARGALRDPAVFGDYLQLLHAGALPEADEFAIRTRAARLIYRHVELARALPAKSRAREGRPDGVLLRMRGIVPRYARELPGCRALRQALSSCVDWDNFYGHLEDFFGRNRACG